MSQASIEVREGKLPAELAAALDPALREALDNSARREVLRVLHRSDRPLSVAEIAGQLTDFTVSEIAYHARVLERAGGAIVGDCNSSPGGDQPLYASGITDNLQALAALRVTQGWDRGKRRPADRRSSTHLTMFRVPRPTRSIRLGDRERGEHEE